MIFLFKQVIFRFHVNFPGCTCFSQRFIEVLLGSSPCTIPINKTKNRVQLLKMAMADGFCRAIQY